MVDRGHTCTRTDRSLLSAQVPSDVSDEPRQSVNDFQPGNWDIICSKEAGSYDHSKYFDLVHAPWRYLLSHRGFVEVGNRRFRILIAQYLDPYTKASSKTERMALVSAIVDQVRQNSTTGRGFVRRDKVSGIWYEVDDRLAREKVGQALRSLMRQRSAKQRRTKEVESRLALRSRSPTSSLSGSATSNFDESIADTSGRGHHRTSPLPVEDDDFEPVSVAFETS